MFGHELLHLEFSLQKIKNLECVSCVRKFHRGDCESQKQPLMDVDVNDPRAWDLHALREGKKKRVEWRKGRARWWREVDCERKNRVRRYFLRENDLSRSTRFNRAQQMS